MVHLATFNNFQILEYLELAIKMDANPNYIERIREEIYCRMEDEGAN